MGKVFISYSHDSPEHSERVLQFSNALRSHGVDAELDQYHTRPPQGWPAWCEEGLRPESSEFVLVVCTDTYRKRVENRVPADEGRGVYWEGKLIYSYLYNDKENTRFIPMLLPGAREADIPRPLLDTTRYRLEVFNLKDAQFEALYRELTHQLPPKPGLGPIIPLAVPLLKPLPAREVLSRFNPADISRILKYAPAQLIGREDELKLLNDAWAKTQNHDPKRPHVLTFVALGGEGKTSLVAKWAAELAAQDWPGCDAAFAWSFYSQGTREQLAASSDLFLKAALDFFARDEKDKEFAAGNAGAFEKGQKLARLVGERRALLILDGLEPLQYAPTAPTPGELKDQGVAALLKGLAAASHGLCVVTTRYSLPDLKAFWQTTAPEVKLLRLSRDAGVHLLKTLGVRGTAQEFATLVEDVKGHALTLTLLGGFLKRAFHGDIRQRDRVKFEKADEKMDGGHAFRTMAAYEQWLLRDGGDEGRREVAVLRLMGLFDRPADAGCLAALRRETILDLTESLAGLADDDWEYCLSGLETAKLLTVNRDPSGALVSLDAHPHLREYFARQLRTQQPDAWRAAHRRLYEYLCATTPDNPQPTLEDLQPLYQAVAHGCQAELFQQTYELYHGRIQRWDEAYTSSKLGALNSDLGATAWFFLRPWSELWAGLSEKTRSWLMNEAAFNLRAIGRLTEALEPLRTSTDISVAIHDWRNAAISLENLSVVKLRLGDIAGSIGDAQQALDFADRTSHAELRLECMVKLADASHQAGNLLKASATFHEVEEVLALHDTEYLAIYSTGGFRSCEQVLSVSERMAWRSIQKLEVPVQKATLINTCSDIERRVTEVLSRVKTIYDSQLLNVALFQLTLTRAILYKAILGQAVTKVPTHYLDESIIGLRQATRYDYLPFSLLTRAWLRFLSGARNGPESAQEDLDEAWEIAERGPMKLFLADIHLTRCRLFGVRSAERGVRNEETKYPWESPAADLAAARKLIEACGYWRRKEELEDAEAAIGRV